MTSDTRVVQEYLCCPTCKKILVSNEGGIRCQGCEATYACTNDIIDFYKDDAASSQSLRANIEFYDHIGEYYDSHICSEGIRHPYTKRRVNEIISLLASETDAQLLIDLGCGTGHVLSIARKYFSTTLGFDISSAMLWESKKKGFQVFRAMIEKLPVRNAHADAVTCFSVLHHLIDQKGLFTEAYRILKPGGYLYTDNDPNYYSKRIIQQSKLYALLVSAYRTLFNQRKRGKLKNVNEDIQKLAEYHHHYTAGLNTESLRQQLMNIGFREIKIIPHGNVRSYSNNTFSNCPWNFQAYMILVALKSLQWRYETIAPQFLMVARK